MIRDSSFKRCLTFLFVYGNGNRLFLRGSPNSSAPTNITKPTRTGQKEKDEGCIDIFWGLFLLRLTIQRGQPYTIYLDSNKVESLISTDFHGEWTSSWYGPHTVCTTTRPLVVLWSSQRLSNLERGGRKVVLKSKASKNSVVKSYEEGGNTKASQGAGLALHIFLLHPRSARLSSARLDSARLFSGMEEEERVRID